MINGRAQKTNGYCPIIGTELNLRQSKSFNMMMDLAYQLLKTKPTLPTRKS